MRKKWLVKFTAMLSMAAMLSGTVTFPVSEVVVAEAEETAQTAQNIISNADFSDADTSAWCGMLGNSKITSETSDTPVYDDVKTYGKIDRDPAQSGTYESFAQDITEQVKDANGAVYTYEFYAKLSDDYKDAPEEQRMVEFAPVITADGNANYMGSYSPEITGTASQALEVGKWTKYEGTFTV
ncbi:MAG: carbohydrate binding domain-containing protein, partial [Lachnospiraceae bacterium]|nr:carbohydrate binding domain-containing protein [Lachnospiraceae bacterium]